MCVMKKYQLNESRLALYYDYPELFLFYVAYRKHKPVIKEPDLLIAIK